MATKREKFHELLKGSLQEKEDWWYAVLETDTGKLTVEHEWSHVNAYKVSESSEGKESYSLEEFRSTDVGRETGAALDAAVAKLKV